MRKSLIFCFFLLGMGIIAMGCQKGEQGEVRSDPQSAQTGSEEAGEKALPSASTVTKENSMVVRVNDKEIVVSDVDRATEILLAQHRNQIPPDRAAQARAVLRKQAVENLISQNLLLEEAGRQGIQPEQKLMDDRYNETVARFSSPEEFQSALNSMGLSNEAFQQEIKDDLMIEILLDEQLKDLKKVTDEEVSAFFRDHPESFKSPEQVRASHILITVDAGATDEQRAQKRLELAGFKGEIEKGADFGEMAGKHSDCPSKARGGDLGYFERGKMVKPFSDAAFAMKVGDTSEIVETQFGYHLIKVTDHQDPKTATLDEVKGQIENLLNRQAKDKTIAAYVAKLRESAKIEYAEGYAPQQAADKR
jgi:peptidyl-prolyl cis-trans isomerase C